MTDRPRRNVSEDGRADTQFTTVIKGGEVVDPASGYSGNLDVAIKGDTIAAVETDFDPRQAATVIDATGQIVTPGLIDLHTHVYWGVEPDPIAARTGVTTWLDAGSAGAFSFPGFREYVVARSNARVFAFLNLAAIGLIGPTWELSNPDYCDLDLAAAIVEEHRDVIRGIKVRIDQDTTRGVGVAPLARARELADRLALPLMTHIGVGPPAIDEVIPQLRPGDILTHCFTGNNMRIVDAGGRLLDRVRELRDRGLILDIGHGAGSFSYRTAEQLLAQGILPDVISSDIHQLSIQAPMFDLPTTLSKFLNLGLTLPEVIDRATARPAAVMRLPHLGTLKPGSPADVALFRIEEGKFTFQDSSLAERRGTKRLINTLTMVAGKPLSPVPDRPLHPWAVLSP